MTSEQDVCVSSHGSQLAGLSIAGPKSRELLACITVADVSRDAFRFMDIRRLDIGFVSALVGRVSYTGDLGYELWKAGLGRFISYDKAADFIGKKAAIASRKNQGGPMRLCCFSLDARDADASGDEPISHQGRVVGWVTSGGFAHASGVSVAMGYVQRELADTLDDWQIEILGEQRQATLQRKPLFDPEGARMRG